MYIELTTQGINMRVGLTDDDFYKMTSTDKEGITEKERIFNQILRQKFEKMGPIEKEFFKILNFSFLLNDKPEDRNLDNLSINFAIGMNKTLRDFTLTLAMELNSKLEKAMKENKK